MAQAGYIELCFQCFIFLIEFIVTRGINADYRRYARPEVANTGHVSVNSCPALFYAAMTGIGINEVIIRAAMLRHQQRIKSQGWLVVFDSQNIICLLRDNPGCYFLLTAHLINQDCTPLYIKQFGNGSYLIGFLINLDLSERKPAAASKGADYVNERMSRRLIATPEGFTINGNEIRRESGDKGRDPFLQGRFQRLEIK